MLMNQNCLVRIALLSFCLLLSSECIVIQMKKDNIFIGQNQSYVFRLNLTQTTSQINPINVSIYHQIQNSLVTTNQYFDYFKYLSPEDIECYNYAIGNSSYLLPCPFLLNNDSVLRIPSVVDTIQQQDQNFRGLNQIIQNFIIDNTPYPFPIGAYPYSPIRVTTGISLQISFDSSYKQLGIRLIFINVTLIVVYVFIIGVLVFRTRKIQEEMHKRAPDYNLKRRASQLSKDGKDNKEEDQQSDIDNYQIVPNEFSLRESRQSKMPSLISSSRDDRITKEINQKHNQ